MQVVNKMRGFTLIEMLLSAAIIALLAGLSAPLYRSLQIKNNIDIAAATIAQSLHRAQILSQGVDSDSQWGVKVQSGSIVLFKGETYATRDSDYDDISDLATNISLSGQTEIVYSKGTGIPSPTGSLTLTGEDDSVTLTINDYGMVAY